MVALVSFAMLWAVAAVTPGPNVLLVSGAALTARRREAWLTVAGILCGTAIWGIAGYWGLGVMFRTAPWLYLTLKFVGGAYIAYLGLKIILRGDASSDPFAASTEKAGRRAFRRGFMTNLANPKCGAFVATIFAATMPQDAPAALGIATVLTMIAISGAWYALLLWGLSLSRVKAGYVRGRRWIERVAGAFFIAFGIDISLCR